MTLTDEVRRMIESALQGSDVTSSGGDSPKINRIIQVNNMELPDLDAVVRDSADPIGLKEDKKIKDTVETVGAFKEGSVGKVQQLTASQIGNVTSFARNPFQFMVTSVFRKFTKGAGVAALAVIIFEAVKAIVAELFKPGRLFDTQFRERIDQQVILFLSRREQNELRQGFKSVITTTIGGLRGDNLQGQIGGNFYNPERIPANFLDSRRIAESSAIPQDARARTFQAIGAAASRGRRG